VARHEAADCEWRSLACPEPGCGARVAARDLEAHRARHALQGAEQLARRPVESGEAEAALERMLALQQEGAVVVVDVGGRRFSTAVSTVKKFPGSLLARVSQPRKRPAINQSIDHLILILAQVLESPQAAVLPRDVRRRPMVFVDGDSASFRLVLQWMRWQVQCSAWPCLDCLCLTVLRCAVCGVVADCRGELPRRLDQDQRRQLLLHADHLRLSELCAALGAGAGSRLTGQVVTADDLPRLRSSGAAGAPLVLSGADMRGEWLAGFDLRGAMMRGCRLDGCVLRGADLRGADLAGCTVAGADLSGAVLDGADLGGVDLSTLSSEAVLPARLAGCELSGARLGGRVWPRGVDLSGTRGARVELGGAVLVEARLAGAVLPGARMAGAVLCGAVLSGARLEAAAMAGVDLTGADLSGQAWLKGAVLTDAWLGGAKMSGGCCLAGADLTGAELVNADLSGADLTGARLVSAGWQVGLAVLS